jgi:hypothetical protein
MTSHMLRFTRGAVALLIIGCSGGTPAEPAPPVPVPPVPVPPNPTPVTGRVPLTELGPNTYKGFAGGLYDDGSNTPPAAHHAEGVARRNAIVPLDAGGAPSAGGRIVMISVGMSNTTQEFCAGASTTTACNSYSFMGLASADAQVNRSTLTIVNGARGVQVATSWDAPTDVQYDTVRLARLQTLGLTEAQVQVAWVKLANPTPLDSLPGTADALVLQAALGRVVRAMKARYPNLRMVFLSSRIYGGYATTTLNPEPYAYESGFSVKWLIAAQARQVGTAAVDATSGSLDYRTGEAPWLAWGPYLWANGTTPRAGDGLTWLVSDLDVDGTHPSAAGVRKVADLLLAFFKTSPYTSCWFLAAGSC